MHPLRTKQQSPFFLLFLFPVSCRCFRPSHVKNDLHVTATMSQHRSSPDDCPPEAQFTKISGSGDALFAPPFLLSFFNMFYLSSLFFWCALKKNCFSNSGKTWVIQFIIFLRSNLNISTDINFLHAYPKKMAHNYDVWRNMIRVVIINMLLKFMCPTVKKNSDWMLVFPEAFYITFDHVL